MDTNENHKLFWKSVLLRSIKFYQRNISSRLVSRKCRFSPTCSEYSIQAIEKYGIIKGLVLTVLRIRKCHPKSPGGEDPVPKLPLLFYPLNQIFLIACLVCHDNFCNKPSIDCIIIM